MGSPPERVDMCGEMEADWIEQIKCRRMKLREMKEGHPCSEAHAPRWSEGHATHSRPGLSYLSQGCSAWLQLRQRPITCFVDSNSHAYALEPCSCPSPCCGSRRHACPWPWKTFDRLFPVPGQGTPCSHDATDHLECAFPAAPAYARASAQVVVFSHHSRPTSPRSSQALICPRLSDQKAREHLSLPFLSGGARGRSNWFTNRTTFGLDHLKSNTHGVFSSQRTPPPVSD